MQLFLIFIIIIHGYTNEVHARSDQVTRSTVRELNSLRPRERASK